MSKQIKRILSVFLTMCVLLSCVAVGSFTVNAGTSISGIDYGLMDNVQYGNILHCWNWSYNNIRLNLQRIAEQGFTAIQTSPLQQLKDSMNESWSTVAGQWWTPYQPIGHTLENNGRGFGSIDEFKALCHEAHQLGIKVIVDVVFNHMSNDYGNAGTISPNVPDWLRNTSYYWHQPLNYSISNFDNRYEVTHYSLLNLPDLNTGHGDIQSYSANYLKELISYGADGFRFDAAKHIETPNDGDGTRSEFWYNVLSTATYYAQSSRGFTPFYYGEVLGGAGGGLGIDAYTYYMSVTDSEASKTIRNGVLNGDSGAAAKSSTGNGAAADRTVLWNESHDEYIGDSDYTRAIDSWHMNKVWGLTGSRNQNAGLYLARPDNTGQRIGVASLTAWTSTEVQAINQFKNRFAGQSEYLSAYGSFAYNVRGNSGAVIVNTGQSNSYAWVSVPSNGMANGTYKDQISGNTFTVSDGWLYGDMGSSGIAVVYNKGPQASVHPNTTAYRSNTYTITLNIENADHGRYSFNNYDYYDFYNGQQITIGADKKVGETTVVYYQAVNMWGEYSNLECSYYWKLAPDTQQRVYFNNANYGYGNIYMYFYHKGTDAIAKSWPGIPVSYDECTDMPYVDVPKGYEGSYVIVNDNYGGQNPSNGYGYKLNGDTVIIDKDFAWGYTPPTTEGISGDIYLKTDTWGLDGAQLKAYVWTGSNNGMASFDWIGGNVYKATLPEGVWKRINFLRVSGSATDEDVWNNIWNQASYMIPTGQNFFAMYDGAWDGSGTWGTYDDATGDATVSLVGDFNGWDQTANVMSLDSDGNVTTTVTLEEGSYTFKVVQASLWYGNGGTILDTTADTSDDGWQLSMTEPQCTLQASGGEYTFTYNRSSRKLVITYVPAVSTEAPSVGTPSAVTIAGDFNDWDPTATVLTYAEKQNVVTTTMNLDRGNYLFKIVEDNTLWYGTEVTVANTVSNLAVSYTGGNLTLQASGGTYTFNYNLKSKMISITYVEAPAPEAGTVSGFTLSGDFNDWSTSTDMMSYREDGLVETKMTLERGAYCFKVYDSDLGLWYGNGGTIKDTTGDAWGFGTTENGCVLVASGGEYTFIYNTKTNALAIEYVPSEAPGVGSASDFIVSGDFNGWATSGNMMTYSSDELVKTTMTLDKGFYTFKIVDTCLGLWYGNGGTIEDSTTTTSAKGWEMSPTASECVLKASGGEYTFTYNIKTNMLIIDCIAAPTPDVGTVSGFSVAGDFNGWDTKSNSMIYASDELVKTTMTLGKGMYYFKVVDTDLGLWYGNGGTIVNTTTDTSDVGWEMSCVAPECVLNASGGEYTFIYNIKTNMLVIEYVPAATPSVGTTSTASVAGDFNGWDYTADKMIYTNGTVVSTTMTLKKGTYYFKIVDSGLWYGNNGSIDDTTPTPYTMEMTAGNCILNASGGDYTFNYDMATSKLSISCVKAPGPSVGDISTASIAGDFNGWDYNANKLVHTSEDVASTTITLDKGTYYFKVVDDGLWYGNNGTIDNTTTATSSIGWEMAITAGECILNATGGDYTFTYDLSTHMLVIDYEAAKIEVNTTSPISLAGSFNGWDPSAEMMTYTSQTTVETTVELIAGSYEFKIVDSLWYGNPTTISDTTSDLELSSIKGNCILQATGGKYTFVYDFINQTLDITFVKSAGPTIGSKSTFIVAGDFNGWATSGSMMKYASDNTVATTMELAEGTYLFKIHNTANGLWYGNDGVIQDTTTTSSSIGWGMDATVGNCTLQASGGTYTFNYNVTTNFLKITFVEAESNWTEGEVSTASVAGDFNDWDSTANMMKCSAKEDVVTTTMNLYTGTYTFKIVDELWYGNGGTIEDTTTKTSSNGWDMSSTDGDCTLVASGGKYTFNYNLSTHKLEILYTADDAYIVAPASSVFLAGDFNEWDPVADNMAYESVNGNIVTFTKKLSAGTYGFKIVDSNIWYGNSGTIEDTTTTTSSVGWEMSSSESANCTLNATGGTYTFRYNTSTHMLIITHS